MNQTEKIFEFSSQSSSHTTFQNVHVDAESCDVHTARTAHVDIIDELRFIFKDTQNRLFGIEGDIHSGREVVPRTRRHQTEGTNGRIFQPVEHFVKRTVAAEYDDIRLSFLRQFAGNIFRVVDTARFPYLIFHLAFLEHAFDDLQVFIRFALPGYRVVNNVVHKSSSFRKISEKFFPPFYYITLCKELQFIFGFDIMKI